MSSNDENSGSESEQMFLECEEDDVDEIEADEDPENDRPVVNVIQPYLYEPEEDDDEERGELANHVRIHRIHALDWCTCQNCQIMPSGRECVCCSEVPQVLEKQADARTLSPSQPYRCITEHPGFQSVCLDVHVLQTAWSQYKQQYDEPYEGPQHKMFRHISYRQFARWIWGFLGSHLRIVLPSCAVSAIRATFLPPGDEDDHVYVGFLA
ncbi:uncharacterized protein [Apostichopus japonicus]|uniref:uncharacterized protein n=1 Tax=Stichopus japonicus TaxID=307972 RepID=UPI003AB6ADF0